MPMSDAELQALWTRVNAAVQRGDWATAFTGAEQLLTAGGEHPLLFKLRASSRERAGNHAGAAEDFRRARTLEPTNPAILAPLGLSLAKAGRHTEAVVVLTEAIAALPDDPTPVFNRAWSHESAGDLRDAEDDYLKASALKPDHAPALAALASVRSRLGDWPGARQAAEDALALAANDIVAATVLAGAEIKDGDPGAAERRLRPLLASGAAAGLHEKAIAQGCLADALDAQGKAAEAFAAYAAANADFRRLYAPRFEAAGTESAGALAERIAGYLDGADPALWRSAASEAAGGRIHVFIVGFPRSGTTLMGQVLATHPDVTTLDEEETVSEIGYDFLKGPGGLERLAALTEAETEDYRARYWALAASRADISAKVFVDKLPLNTLGLPVIRRLFPDARVLFMRRDPRDVILSCFRQRFALNAGTWELLTLDGAARFYDSVMRVGALAEEKLGLATRNQSFERLVGSFAEEVAAICAFIGIEPVTDMHRFDRQAAANAVATPSAAQLAKGLNADGIGRWRPYAEQLQPVLPRLQPWIEAFGYEAPQ